jgi:phosphotransferase system HPr-like phosphotransfer protein
VILLNVSQNSEITIEADGDDEEAAINDLKQLIESDFEAVNERVKI